MAHSSQDIQADSGLAALFKPRAIAVVGASASAAKVGYQMVHSLAHFPGRLFPINPKEARIHDLPAYPRVVDVPTRVDLAILTVPATAVPAALRDCAAAGVRAAMVCAGGFAESGEAGQALQQEVTDLVREAGMRLLGPNTSGYLNPVDGITASFVPGVSLIAAGRIAVVAQSGGVNHALAFLAHNDGIGLRLGVGLGNSINVGFADVLEYLAQDQETQAIALHVEGVADGRAFIEAVERATQRVPVVVLKVGRADINDFARSHTGVLTGNYALTRSALLQAGAVVVEDTVELLDAAHALSCARLPALESAGVGIVTSQAGPGLIITDVLRSADVRVPELSASTREQLSTLLPPLTAQHNPVDTGRPDKTFSQVVASVAKDPAIDAVIAYALHEPDAIEPVAALSEARTEINMPLIFGTGGLSASIEPTLSGLSAQGVPAYTSPERAARAIRALITDAHARFLRAQRLSAPASTRAAAQLRIAGTLDEDAAKALLREYGIRTPQRRACTTREEARAAYSESGGPVVVKVLNPAIIHKSDVGGVHLNINSPSALEQALDAIDHLVVEGVYEPNRYLVEEMVARGLELIVGGTRDESFGPVVLFGMGGIAAEVTQDVTLRLAPLAEIDARQMIGGLKASKLLTGYRGQPAVDQGELVRVLTAVSQLLIAHPEITELDINPLRATEKGLYALDAVVIAEA
ncbi:MAG: acetate--CoA ligase [Ktedonobacteraceae bacterium]